MSHSCITTVTARLGKALGVFSATQPFNIYLPVSILSYFHVYSLILFFQILIYNIVPDFHYSFNILPL